MKNKSKLTILLITITLLITIIGITFAYFSVSIAGNSEAKSIIMKTAKLDLLYNSGDTIIVADKILPGWSANKTFTVKNNSTVTCYYDIVWTNIINTFVNNGDLVYELSGSNNKAETEAPKTNETILSGIEIEPGITHTYTLTITFKNQSYAQDENQGVEFIGKIEIKEGNATNKIMIGDFIQPWFTINSNPDLETYEEKDWQVSDWEDYFGQLKELGMEYFVYQWSVQTENNVFKRVDFWSQTHYEFLSANNGEYHGHILQRILTAGKNTGIKVFVGLNHVTNEEWYENFSYKDTNWRNQYIANLKATINEIYNNVGINYINLYSDVFYGWYLPAEMWNTKDQETIDAWIEILNEAINYINVVSPEMRFMFSAFTSTYTDATPQDTKNQWTTIIENVNFRSKDIISIQDGFANGLLSEQEIKEFLISYKEAINNKIKYWIIIENFRDSNSAEVEDVINQIKLASKYAEQLMCFSIGHYFNKNINPTEYNQYKNYVQ